MTTKKDIRKSLATMSKEERKTAQKLLDEMNIDIAEGDKSLTGTKPRGFTLENQFYKTDHFREIYLKICEIAASKNRDGLDRFFDIKGRTRKYFSRNYNDLSDDFRKINGTDIYAELNENATTLKKRCEKIILKFGLDLSSFSIE